MKFLSFLCTKWMENCEAMTSSPHSFAYSYRLVKKCFLKICETSKCHNFLIFQPIFIRFSLLCLKIFTLSSEIKLNLLWISSLKCYLWSHTDRKYPTLQCMPTWGGGGGAKENAENPPGGGLEWPVHNACSLQVWNFCLNSLTKMYWRGKEFYWITDHVQYLPDLHCSMYTCSMYRPIRFQEHGVLHTWGASKTDKRWCNAPGIHLFLN